MSMVSFTGTLVYKLAVYTVDLRAEMAVIWLQDQLDE